MDIIIKNVEMPKDCKSCFCSYWAAASDYGAESDGDVCEVADKEIDFLWETRPAWCPLVEYKGDR